MQEKIPTPRSEKEELLSAAEIVLKQLEENPLEHLEIDEAVQKLNSEGFDGGKLINKMLVNGIININANAEKPIVEGNWHLNEIDKARENPRFFSDLETNQVTTKIESETTPKDFTENLGTIKEDWTKEKREKPSHRPEEPAIEPEIFQNIDTDAEITGEGAPAPQANLPPEVLNNYKDSSDLTLETPNAGISGYGRKPKPVKLTDKFTRISVADIVNQSSPKIKKTITSPEKISAQNSKAILPETDKAENIQPAQPVDETLKNENSPEKAKAETPEPLDPKTLFLAIKTVIESKKATPVFLEEKLQIPLFEAGRYIEEMKNMGVIGPWVQSKNDREVFWTESNLTEHFKNNPSIPREVLEQTLETNTPPKNPKPLETNASPEKPEAKKETGELLEKAHQIIVNKFGKGGGFLAQDAAEELQSIVSPNESYELIQQLLDQGKLELNSNNINLVQASPESTQTTTTSNENPESSNSQNKEITVRGVALTKRETQTALERIRRVEFFDPTKEIEITDFEVIDPKPQEPKVDSREIPPGEVPPKNPEPNLPESSPNKIMRWARKHKKEIAISILTILGTGIFAQQKDNLGKWLDNDSTSEKVPPTPPAEKSKVQLPESPIEFGIPADSTQDSSQAAETDTNASNETPQTLSVEEKLKTAGLENEGIKIYDENTPAEEPSERYIEPDVIAEPSDDQTNKNTFDQKALELAREQQEKIRKLERENDSLKTPDAFIPAGEADDSTSSIEENPATEEASSMEEGPSSTIRKTPRVEAPKTPQDILLENYKISPRAYNKIRETGTLRSMSIDRFIKQYKKLMSSDYEQNRLLVKIFEEQLETNSNFTEKMTVTEALEQLVELHK